MERETETTLRTQKYADAGNEVKQVLVCNTHRLRQQQPQKRVVQCVNVYTHVRHKAFCKQVHMMKNLLPVTKPPFQRQLAKALCQGWVIRHSDHNWNRFATKLSSEANLTLMTYYGHRQRNIQQETTKYFTHSKTPPRWTNPSVRVYLSPPCQKGIKREVNKNIYALVHHQHYILPPAPNS